VFANFPGKGRAHSLVRRAHSPRKPFGGRAKAWKGLPDGGSTFGCKCMDPYIPLTPPGQLEAWAQLADSAARPLQHSNMGGRKMGAIAEGEERETLGVCPLSRRRDSLPGLGLGQACAWRVGGKRGELGVPEGCFPPRALVGCALLPPIRGLWLRLVTTLLGLTRSVCEARGPFLQELAL
jgi:hypothetical protein